LLPAPALPTRTGGFHGGVQRQDVDLESDAVDHADAACGGEAFAFQPFRALLL